MLPGRSQAIEATDPRRVPASRTANGHPLEGVVGRERAMRWGTGAIALSVLSEQARDRADRNGQI